MSKEPTMEDLQKQITANLAAATRIIKEAEAARAERDAERDRRDAERDRRAAELAEEQAARNALADKQMAENRKMIKKLGSEVGNLGNNRGFAFERAVFNTLADAKELCGIRLDGVRFNASAGKGGYQYDIVALNGKKTIVIEAKLSLSVEDVLHFADNRLPAFAGVLPEYAGNKKIIGAMVYQRTDAKGAAVAAALSRGMLVLCADNKKNLWQVKTPGDIKERNTPPAKK